MSSELYIGLMTGTSVDAIDAVLCCFSHEDPNLESFELIDALSFELSLDTRQLVKQLFQPGDNEIDRLGCLDVELSNNYADAVFALLNRNALDRSQITAIGCHGQTVRHRPNRTIGDTPFSMQIGDPNTLAARSGITVIADFRRKDIALGGEGAPLAPGFHRYISSNITKPIAFLNIGGISNVTLLNQPNGHVLGFDTGPGNALLDYWVQEHNNQPFDNLGTWASSGETHTALLHALLDHPFFRLMPPKSTGKEEFSPQWLMQTIHEVFGSEHAIAPEDVQATLVELTTITIANSINYYGDQAVVFVCGGGVKNEFLLYRLGTKLPNTKILSSETLGVHPDWVEACAFAWLARQRMHNLHGNIPSVTGAQRPALLGGIWSP